MGSSCPAVCRRQDKDKDKKRRSKDKKRRKDKKRKKDKKVGGRPVGSRTAEPYAVLCRAAMRCAVL